MILNIDAIKGYKKLLKAGIHVNAIVTDPPYLLKNVGGGKSSFSGMQKHETGLKNIECGFNFRQHFNCWKKLCKPFNAFFFLSNSQISKTMKLCEKEGYITTLIIWHKPDSIPFANNVWRQDIEFILHVREKGATFKGDAEQKRKVKTHFKVKSKYGHPTEKPLKLIKELLEICSNENDIILDPFLGSGTTAVAALQLSRRYIGFEISKEYFEIARTRIASCNKTPLHVEPNASGFARSLS